MTSAQPLMILEWVHAAFLIVGSVLAVLAFRSIWAAEHKKRLMKVKRKVFALIAPATLCLTVAFLLHYFTCSAAQGVLSIADIFFVLGYVLFIAGFAYFWYEARKMHRLHIKDPIFILGVTCGVIIWLVYLFRQVLLPYTLGPPMLYNFIQHLYPIAVSLMFLLTLVIQPLLRARLIRTPLWYISSAMFTYFIGFMMFFYHQWQQGPDVLQQISTVLLIISAFYLCLGFFAAKQKYG